MSLPEELRKLRIVRCWSSVYRIGLRIHVSKLGYSEECIVEAAEEPAGRGRGKHPEWFKKSFEDLMPLIQAKNQTHQRVLNIS